MRLAVTALVIFVLLAIWLTTRHPDNPQQHSGLAGRDVTSLTVPLETGRPIEHQDASQEVLSDEAVSDAMESNGFSDPTTRTAEIEFGPDMRAGIVDYLSKSGLAVIDSERVADSALDGARQCVELAFGNRGVNTVLGDGNGEPKSDLIEACMLNVFADYGLTDIPVTEAELAIGRR